MWEYVKGSEVDFEGAPEWAVFRISYNDRDCFCEGFRKGHRFKRVDGLQEGDFSVNPFGTKLIAERRKVDDLQSDTTFDTVQRPAHYNQSGIECIIAERGTRYGEFKDGAAIMQQLKDVMKDAPKWEALKPSQKEALEMIQHKIGRVLNGDPDYDDNWKDIAGYATLIVKELSK